MNTMSLCTGALLGLFMVGCAVQDKLDTSRLTRFDEYHANLEANGARYTLDAYIIPFYQPFFITVERDDGKPMELAEAAAVAYRAAVPSLPCGALIWTAAMRPRPNGSLASNANASGSATSEAAQQMVKALLILGGSRLSSSDPDFG